MTAPRLWGSWTSSRTRRNRAPGRPASASSSSRYPRTASRATAPWWPRPRSRSSASPPAVPDRHPLAAAELLQLVDPPVPPLRIEQHPLDLAGPASDGLLDRVEAGKDHREPVRSTTAIAAIPSRRPVKPSPFELVPRTLTAEASTPRISAMRARIAPHVRRELRRLRDDDGVDVADREAAPGGELCAPFGGRSRCRRPSTRDRSAGSDRRSSRGPPRRGRRRSGHEAARRRRSGPRDRHRTESSRRRGATGVRQRRDARRSPFLL